MGSNPTLPTICTSPIVVDWNGLVSRRLLPASVRIRPGAPFIEFMQRYNMKKFLFYFLSFTWGLPLTLIGLLVSSYLILIGYRPKRYGLCWCFNIGKDWGGLNLGLVFLTDQRDDLSTKTHEHGHGVQNCIFGPLMLIVVCIPSVVRYWYREWLVRSGIKKYSELSDYDSVWFEGSATKLGEYIIKEYDTYE